MSPHVLLKGGAFTRLPPCTPLEGEIAYRIPFTYSVGERYVVNSDIAKLSVSHDTVNYKIIIVHARSRDVHLLELPLVIRLETR